MRDGKIVLAWVAGRVEKLGELLDSESCEDRYNVGIVGEVKVKILIEWECFGATVKGYVDLRMGIPKCLVLEARKDFLLVAEADSSLSIVVRMG